MNNTHDKIFRTLEFQKVTHQVAEFAASNMAKTKLKNLRPTDDYNQIVESQDETEDGVTLLLRKGGLPVSSFADIRPHLKRLAIGAALNGEEIADIRRILSQTQDMVRFFENAMEDEDIELHRLGNTRKAFQSLPELLKKIEATIDEGGKVLDDASPTLRGIRTGIQSGQGDIRTALNRITQGSQSKYLTDAIITMRNDRFVIPVKAENRNQFGGVVHDQSASGQTLFIEPQSVVDKNNKLKRLQVEERQEEERILAELSGEITANSVAIEQNFHILIHLDFINAKAKYARAIKASRPKVSQENYVELYDARHPLIDPEDIVANDLIIGENYKTIIVTGPNTGGKTIVLKTLGLLQLMGQSGLQLPVAKNSQMGIFDAVYADIGDEQSIEQSLSTFSSHMTNIISILENMTKDSLVLFDELGAGTDPQEGAALAIAILDYIRDVGPYAMITSHYPELKAYGYNRPDTINASMAFDVDTLSPTYELQIGVPGRSNAFEIVKRLGMQEEIIKRGRDLMSGESQSVNDMIQDLEVQRRNAREEYENFHDNYLEASKLRRQLEQAYNDLQNERDNLIEKARQDANEKVEKAQADAAKIIEDIRQKQMTLGTSGNIKEHELIDAQTRLERMRTREEKDLLAKNKVLKKVKQDQKLKPGMEVEVVSFGQNGTLVEKVGKKEWMVQLGSLKMKVKEKDFIPLETSDQISEPKRQVRSASKPRVSTEVDIRGERYEKAMDNVSQYLDAALLNNYSTVNIIHGHGTGALRDGVHKLLRKHPQVESFNLAPANQGGTGATIVQFKE